MYELLLIYKFWIQTANATEKMVNSAREQGENKSGKSRPTKQNITKLERIKTKSIGPVSYLSEAIQLQEEEEEESGNRQ